MVERLPDWEPRLVTLLEGAAARPFVLGEWDCALFAAACIEAVTGIDGGATFRGRYKTAIGYQRVLRRAGFADLFTPFDALLGERVSPLFCGRGDIVSDGERVGVMWASGPLFVGGAADDAGHEVGLVSGGLGALIWGWRV